MLEKYDGTYLVDLLTVKNGESMMDCVFTKEEANTGMFKETIKDYIEDIIDKETVLVEGEACNIFINGIIVRDLSEIGLIDIIDEKERIEILETTIYRLVGDDVQMVLTEKGVELSNEELGNLIYDLQDDFVIYDWYEQMQEVVWNYFDEREIKDISGKIVKI